MTLASYLSEHKLSDGVFAAQVGVSGELVRLWRHGQRTITPKWAVKIAELTGIPRHELRPDLWDAPAPKRRKRAPAHTEAAE